MARGSPTKLGLALVAAVFVITTTHAEESCRTGCRGSPQIFKYAEGTTYKYNFDSKIELTLSSAENQKSLTEVKALVLLTQQAQCNQILRVQDIQIIGNDGKKHSQIPDLDKPIRLNFHDGHLEDSICVDPTDSQTSLNIKRAIASIFQANVKNSHETDVFGQCPTEVNQSKEGNAIVITKARNLNRCAYRENIRRDFLSSVFNIHSEIKSSPLLNADYSAKLHIKNGIVDEATVTETYLYVPFSVGANGAKAQVETKLKLAGTGNDNAPVKVSQPRSIIFEDPHPVNAPQSNVNTILNAVKETAKTIDVTVGTNTAKEFINLIKILRVSNKDDQLAVYNQVKAGVGFKDKAAGKKIFLDALLRAGNGDNVVVAIELLKNKELNEVEEKLVYLGLSLVRHPTVESVNSAAALLNQPHLPREAFLGIGTLAGKFCRQHSCKNVDSVNKLTQKLIQKLGDGKAANRQDENDIIFVLKALRNIHHLDDSILGKIVAIAQDKKRPNRLRVAALETYLADACKDKLRDSALGILKDIQQDSEVRIKAYLAAVQCANPKVATALKALLEHEPSYQVGGFIVSHLRHARSSANQDKELIKQHLGNIVLPKRFPVDLRKWSANGEFSYSIDSLGIANSIEGNVIYSQNSFLPRSTSLNLTAEIFGHNLNFLEIETRQENLDRLLEHYLGPKGLLRSHTAQELWESEGKGTQHVLHQLREKLEKTLRSRRDLTKNEIDQIEKQVQIKTNELNKDLDLDLSVKAFGSELLFLNINDDTKKYTPEAVIDKIINGLNKGLDKIKNFEETLRTNLLFLDIDIAYPSSSGFPLRLAVEGAANIQVKAAGALDVRALFKKDTTVKISLIPSANIEISGRFTVDTWATENGLKIITNLHTATGSDLIVNLFQDGIDVKLSLPVEKQNLISVSHDIVIHSRKLATPEHNTPLKFAQNKEFGVCFDQLNQFIGLTLCAEIQGPNLSGKQVPVLPFPFAGDAKLSLNIEREDISQYHYRHVVYNEANKIGSEIALEALGKNNQKKVGLNIDAFLAPTKYIKATLTSPITNAELEGKVTETPQEKSVSLKLSHDNQEYFGKLGVAIAGNANKQTYKPLVQYRTPQDSGLQVPPYRVEGQVIVEQNGQNAKYIFDNVKIIIPEQKTISFNGNLGHEPSTIFADLTVSDGTISGNIKGRLQADRKAILYNLQVTNTYNPDAGFHLKGELHRNDDGFKNFIQAVHGRDLSSKTNILTIENSLTLRKQPSSLIITKNSVVYPLVGVNGKVDLTLKENSVNYNVDVQYNDVKVGSTLDANVEPTPEGLNYKADLDIWALNNRVEVRAERKIVAPAQSQITNSLQVNGKKFEVSGKVKHLVRPQDIDVGTDITLKSPTHPNPLKLVSGLKLNNNDVDAHVKISSGGTVYADAFLKANKAGNANGSIKVNLKDDLTINGQVKANKGVGNGELVIESPSSKRSVKLDGTFTIHDPNYNIVFNLYPSFSQDKSKKITLNTHTKLTAHQIDSKNTIDILGNNLQANLKATCDGDWNNGKVNADADVTLPNDHYFSGKVQRELHTDNNNVRSGNIIIDLEHRKNKNTAGAKFNLKGKLNNFNANDKTVDVEYQIQSDCGNGKTISLDLGVKRQLQGDAEVIEINSKLGGSILTHPQDNSFKSTRRGLVGNYEVASSCPQHKLAIKGKYDLVGERNPISGDVDFDLSFRDLKIKTVKVVLSGSVLKTDRVELKGQTKVYVDSPEGVLIDVDTNGQVRADDKEGQLSGSLKTHKLDPIAVSAGYGLKEGKDTREIQANGALSYGQGKHLKGSVALNKLPNHEYKLDLKLETPIENFKNNHVTVHGKRNADNTHHQNEVTLTADGKTWTANTDLKLSQLAPSIDVKVKCPEGKLSELLVKANKQSEHQFSAELKLIHQKRNFQLTASVDANVESIDDFHIKVNANSPTLKLDKITVEAQNKPAKSGRRIQVTAKSGNKNLLAGSTSYTARQENEKLIIEGSGSFKVKEETKSANFKYIRQNLSQQKNGETGIEISFDAGLGDRAIDAELKVTNKQFRILNSYCEEKKQCAHIEIDAKTNVDDLHEFNQEIEVAIDLRRLGLSHEFGLKAVTNRKDWILDHTVDVHFQSQDQSKYQYSLYIHPRKAGASLSTPKRTLAVEASINAPTTLLKDGGKVVSEVAVYLDKKNKPNEKSALTAWLTIDPKGNVLDGEAKFTNPALQRPLLVSLKSQVTHAPTSISISATIIADVFAQQNQKLIVKLQQRVPNLKDYLQVETYQSIEVLSEGLHINMFAEEIYAVDRKAQTLKGAYTVKYQGHDSIISLEASPRQIEFLTRVYNNDLLKISSKLNINKDQQVVDTEIHSFGVKPAVSHLEIKNLNTIKFTIARKETPNDKLLLNAGFIPGQIADVRGELYKNGKKTDLGHASVKLDEANFLKNDYDLNSDNIINLVVKPIKETAKNHLQELQSLVNKLVSQLIDDHKKIVSSLEQAIPNLQPLRNHYVTELKNIKDEILADKTIQDVSEFLNKVVAALVQVFGDTFAHVSELVENIAKSLQNTFGKVIESLEKQWPEVKARIQEILNQVLEIVDNATEVVLLYVAKAIEIVAKFQPELKQLTTLIGDVGHDLGRVLVKVTENIRLVLLEQWRQLQNELNNLPAIEQLHAEYEKFVKEGLPTSEAFINTFHDIVNTIKDIVPGEELKNLIQVVGDYVEKKLSRQPVDDAAAIERIIQATFAVIRRVVGIISGAETTPELQNLKFPLLSANLLNKLPRFVALKFSPISYLLHEDVPEPTSFLLSLINHPRNWVAPFPLYGLVAQGQHIFTFDGKHLTFPGKCNYLLARDAVDGNFTIIGSYTNGILSAITLSVRGDSITFKTKGQVLLNNAVVDLPVRKPNIAAYLGYGNRINIESESGVVIRCGLELVVCSVTVSGFYHGKLRGLLGNGNNEPYDDFTTASGKIVTSESEFGNSYKTTSGCPAVQTVDHHGHHQAQPACDKLFGWESSLRLCYPFVKTDNFKLACEHGLSAGVKDTEFATAIAYVAACRQHNIPISVPAEYVKCTNGDKPTTLGDTFSVKTPGKAVDIVLLVDTVKKNEPVYKEYVQPLVQQLTTELAAKGISDVEFHLIAYGGENQWPSHITTNGKSTFKGKAPALKFSEAPKQQRLETGCQHVDNFLEVVGALSHDVKLALGEDLQAKTYAEAIAYPFRAHAVKSILVVTGNSCEKGRLYPLQVLRTLLYRSKAINLNLITPFEKLTVDAKHAKDIVGFNDEGVFTLGAGKKTGKGAELHKELEYNDYCVDFTVQNNGNVFVLDNFLAAKGAQRKQFVQVTAHNIVEQVTSVEQGLDCECKLNSPFTGQNVCTVVHSKDKVKKAGAKA